MAVELVNGDGLRRTVPGGWVIVTLALAGWGLFALLGLALWALAGLFVS